MGCGAMIIVHVVEAWKGGIASYVSDLISEQCSRGHEVYLIADKSAYLADVRELPVDILFYNATRNPFRFFTFT